MRPFAIRWRSGVMRCASVAAQVMLRGSGGCRNRTRHCAGLACRGVTRSVRPSAGGRFRGKSNLCPRIHPEALASGTRRSVATPCRLASPSKELRLILGLLGSSHVGLGPQDMADGVFVPTRASVAAIASFGPDRAAKSDLSTVRPSVRVDSISIPSGETTGVPCRRARRPNRCRSDYSAAMKAPSSYGQGRCGNCQARARLALITTKKDSVDTVTDLRSFLGKIDSAGDARLLLDASAVWLTNDSRWLGVQREFDGTCQPLEEVDVGRFCWW